MMPSLLILDLFRARRSTCLHSDLWRIMPRN